MKLIKKLYKKILFIIIAIYLLSIFITQQKALNNYKTEVSKYETEIEQAKETKESLLAMKENANSPEYIEEIAREKLGMYLPNEKVYIDIGK